MQCPECQHPNPAEAKFCLECGSSLARACGQCGVKLPPTAKFCPECGAALGAAPRAPVSSPLAAPAEADGERRQLTVMLCDLVGSTDLSQRLDAEDLRTVVRAYQKSASEAIERHEGHIAQHLGDGLLVYFGYPRAHEDDAERAVRAGLEILSGLALLNDRLEAEHGIRLAARIGVHTGPVVIGSMGVGSRSEVLALGDTSTVAARVEGSAEPGTVWVSATTQRLVAGLFVVEDRGAQRLKGVAEAMVLYRVVQPSGVRSRLDVSAKTLTRFVGREVELATLVDRWERAQEGEGQSVFIFGEAGVGKSRLIYQLHESLTAVPHTWLECAATPYTQGTPLHPIVALVRERLAFASEDTTPEKIRKLKIGLRSLTSGPVFDSVERPMTDGAAGPPERRRAQPSAETVSLLADLLGLPPPTPLQMSPELRRRKTIDLLVRWTLSMSAAQSMVLLIEDLHWSDASTLELLGQVIAQNATARVLLVASARPEFTPPWPARSNVTKVQLARLTKRQARDMVMAVGGEELPADTLEALVARADGVPLFVEELTKTMAASAAACGVEAIPATLADSLMARLDRLSAAKEVAQRAAVLGREFAYPLLVAVAGMDEAALRQGLDRLADAEIVFARGEAPAATYTFKHALLQEAAYGSLLKRTRQQLHGRAAEELERVAAEPELIARHYDQAGLATQAGVHYQRAGERATQRSANEEAIGHLRRALALVETLPETQARDRRELELQMALGAPLAAARGWSHPEYEQTFARARELASRIGDSPELPRVLAGMAGAYLVKGDVATAGDVAREALAAAEHTGVAFDRLVAHTFVGQPLLYQGRFLEALRHFERSIELYEPGEHGPLAHNWGFDRGVHAHGRAALCLAFLGQPDRALAASETAVALARRVRHPFSLADAVFWAGVVHLERGEPERVRERTEELLNLAGQLGLPLYLGLGGILRGWTRVESGDGESGIAEMQQAIAALAESGSGLGSPRMLFVVAESLRKVGSQEAALGTLALAVARAAVQGDHFYDAELHRLRAEVLLDVGGDAADEAEALFAQSLEVARGQAAKTFELRAATSLARLWQCREKRVEAHTVLAPVYDWFTEGFETRDLKEAKRLLDELRP